MSVRGFKIAKGWEDKEIEIPVRSTKNAAAYDIKAAEDVVIPMFRPGVKPTLIPTGLKAYCAPDEWYMLANRSGGPKKGLVMANSIGIADADYYENETNDGHFMFQYWNFGSEDIVIKKGERIGQLVFMKYLLADEDNATGVRTGGFGSTGD